MTSDPIVIIGGGEHARVIEDALRAQGLAPAGYLDPSGPAADWPGARHLGDDDAAQGLIDGGATFILGVGGVRETAIRRKVAAHYDALDARWFTLVHPGAGIASDASVADGAFVAIGALVNLGARLGRHVIVNTGAIVEHDVVIADHAIIAPGAVLGGGVVIGPGAIVGLGAAVRDHITIGAGAVVGMGAVVVASVPPDTTVVGVPAREVKEGD